jgi:hypothetical protein
MEDEKRSSKPSHSWGPVGCSEWPYQAALPCHVIIELLRPFRGHTSIISGGANHGGTMPKRWAKERRKGGKGREGPASALRRERTQMSSHQRPARPAGQQASQGRQNFRASHIPRGRPRVAGWVKVRGTRCRDGQVDGSSEEFQVSCLGGGVSRFDAGSARARSNATQRRWHAARRTPGEALQLRCNVWHCTPWPASHSLSRSSASKTGRLGHTSRICASRDWVSPCAGVEHRRVEAWNFPDNGGEAIVAWSLAPNLVMADPVLYPTAHHESIIRPSLRF